MGYYIRALPAKKRTPKWKVQYVTYRASATSDSTAIKPKKEWDIPTEVWRELGFHPSMSIEQARAVKKSLNYEIEKKRREERRREVEEQFRHAKETGSHWFPDDLLDEFEREFLLGRFPSVARTRNVMSQWRCAQRVVAVVDLEPSEWSLSPHRFYDFFFNQKYSPSYLQKVMRLVNLWGYFVCRRRWRAFLPVPSPRGIERRRLVEAYLGKNQGRSAASEPLVPEALERARESVPVSHYNWLYLTVWLGLRPSEVDRLQDRSQWRVEMRTEGPPILWVFQTKLISRPFADRWKPIPLVTPEQMAALKIVESMKIARPTVKSLARVIDRGIRLYGGRKGFVDLMMARGFPLESISQWMGHSSIERTWRSYKHRRTVHYRSTAA